MGILTPEQRRYFFVQSCIGAAVVNAVLNGAIGVGVMLKQASLPVWGLPSVAADLAATAFGVTFGTCLGVALQAKLDLAKGKITAPKDVPFETLLARFPSGLMKRAVGLGLVSMPIFLPPALVLLVLIGEESLARTPFVALKAAFAAVQGALVTPFLLLAAVLDRSREAATVSSA